MATIRILYFAHLADRTGVREETYEITDGASITELKSALSERHERLAEALDACRVALDEEFRTPDATLSDGQTVAFIPPVSGG